MADIVFNIAKGQLAYYTSLPATNDALIGVLLKTVESDALMKDRTTLSAVLGANTEANFTNYVRKTLTAVAGAVDNTNDWWTGDADDITYTTAGGATNNTTAKLLICYDGDTTSGTDANITPLVALDCVFTTDGSSVVVPFNALGWAKAA